MHTKWLGLAALVVGICGSSGVLAGCAEERDPINRVQQGAVAKSFFLGPSLTDYKDDPEFRTKSFNIDSGANSDNAAGTIGGASAVERVRWDVTEKFLFARRSYQEAPGADNRGLPRKEVSPGKWEFPTPPTGTIIAAYAIESHFDIKRAYNPSTGEEQNIIDENTTDRPWYQREYMRIDWSKNVADSTSGDISWIFGEGTDITPVDYSQTNDNDPDKPHFETDNGYFDITNKFQMKTNPVGLYGVPECVLIGFFNGTTSFDCTPQEVKVRSSFVRLTGDEDFEPFEESNAFRDIVGNWGNAGSDYFREFGGAPITAWDPQYGYTDANTKTFYSIHNIWDKSHIATQCASNDDVNPKDGTADACAPSVTGYNGPSLGSQCDVYVGRCTIPVRDRKVKTSVWALNADAPQELTDQVSTDGKTITAPGPIEENTVTWNQFMKVSVAYRREVECRRTGGDGNEAAADLRDFCHGLYFTGTGPDSKQMVAFGGWGLDTPKEQAVDQDKTTKKDTPIISTCHNPVRAYDPAVCGNAKDVLRLGDIRKNYAIYWPYASRAPYGGVASIGGDPITGEMLGVTATIMMRSATFAAAQQRDIIAIANGDVKVEDFITGVQATNYATKVKDGKVVDGLGKAWTSEQLAAVVKNLNHPAIQAAVGEDPATLNAMKPMDAQLAAAKKRMLESPQAANIAKANADLSALTDQVNATPYKTELANRGLYQLVAQSQDKSSDVYNAIKTFADTDPNKMQDIIDQYQAYLGNRGVCFADGPQNAPVGSIYQASLAPYFKKLYGSLDPIERGVKIYNDLLREAIKGIAFHEIGHSLGLRHNFTSSWDALNYAPQYWQLRTNEGQSAASCNGQPRNSAADTCMGPRYLDPESDEEQGVGSEARPGIEYFGNTSTMEYQIERFGETVGAGTYDLHAMKVLYGRVLETMDTRVITKDDQQYFAVKMLSQGIAKDMILDPTKGYGKHYTSGAVYAKVFDPTRDCRAATDDEKAAAKWRIVHGKVCSQQPRNHLAYDDMKSDVISFKIPGQGTVPLVGVNGVRWHGVDENGKTLVRWAYRYGEDYSRGGFVHAKPFDSGADFYEITENVIRRFDAQYPWAYFRRQNKEFAWWAIPSSVDNNTYARMRAYHWNTTTDIGRDQASALVDDDMDRPEVVAAQEMFKFLQRNLLQPEPGSYGTGADTARRTALRPGAQTIFDVQSDSESSQVGTTIGTLGIVDGRFVQIDFDSAKGGSWDYANFPTHAPFDEEKALALWELVDSRPTLSTVSRDNALDGRDPYISFRTDTPNALDRLIGGILSEDWEAIAPSMNADGTTTSGLNFLSADPSAIVRPAGNKGIIFPNMGYSNQISTGIYALLFSRFSTDMELTNKMRVRYRGDAGAAIPADRLQAFTDPVTGIVYQATRFGSETIMGRAVETGVGSRMLQRVAELSAKAYKNPVGPDLNGDYVFDMANGQPVIADAATEKDVRRYIGLLDGMRQVGNILGGGPLGGGQGGEGDE
jgi:hypothetical protein